MKYTTADMSVMAAKMRMAPNREWKEAAVMLEQADDMLNKMNKIANWENAGPFITGASQEERDPGQMPERFFVCPAYGSSDTYAYEKMKNESP